MFAEINIDKILKYVYIINFCIDLDGKRYGKKYQQILPNCSSMAASSFSRSISTLSKSSLFTGKII